MFGPTRSSLVVGLAQALLPLNRSLFSSLFPSQPARFPGFSHSREIPGGLVSCLDPIRWASSWPIISSTIGLRALWPLRCRIRPSVHRTHRPSHHLSIAHCPRFIGLVAHPANRPLSARPGRSGQGCKDLQSPHHAVHQSGLRDFTSSISANQYLLIFNHSTSS